MCMLFARLEEHLTAHRMKYLCHSMTARVGNAHLYNEQAGSSLVEKNVRYAAEKLHSISQTTQTLGVPEGSVHIL